MGKGVREHIWSQVLEDACVPEMTVADTDMIDDMIYTHIESYKRDVKAAKDQAEEDVAYSHLFFWVTAQHEWRVRLEELEAKGEA